MDGSPVPHHRFHDLYTGYALGARSGGHPPWRPAPRPTNRIEKLARAWPSFQGGWAPQEGGVCPARMHPSTETPLPPSPPPRPTRCEHRGHVCFLCFPVRPSACPLPYTRPFLTESRTRLAFLPPHPPSRHFPVSVPAGTPSGQEEAGIRPSSSEPKLHGRPHSCLSTPPFYPPWTLKLRGVRLRSLLGEAWRAPGLTDRLLRVLVRLRRAQPPLQRRRRNVPRPLPATPVMRSRDLRCRSPWESPFPPQSFYPIGRLRVACQHRVPTTFVPNRRRGPDPCHWPAIDMFGARWAAVPPSRGDSIFRTSVPSQPGPPGGTWARCALGTLHLNRRPCQPGHTDAGTPVHPSSIPRAPESCGQPGPTRRPAPATRVSRRWCVYACARALVCSCARQADHVGRPPRGPGEPNGRDLV